MRTWLRRLLIGGVIFLLLISLSGLLVWLFHDWTEAKATTEVKEEVSEISNASVLKKLQTERLATAKTVEFALIGDPRGKEEVFLGQLAEAARRGAKFAIILGDLVPSNTAQHYYHLTESLENAPLPVLVIPGNHDYGRNGAARYQRIFGPGDYSFDMAGYHFIMLDNAEGRLTDSQLHWLEGQLQITQPKLVFIHMPPANIARWSKHGFGPGAVRFVSLMEKYHPRGVFMSHIHAYDQYQYHGVPYTVTGGGGAKLSMLMGKQAAFYHFILVTINAKGTSSQVVKIRSKVMPEFEPEEND
jgi:hypothetical protein